MRAYLCTRVRLHRYVHRGAATQLRDSCITSLLFVHMTCVCGTNDHMSVVDVHATAHALKLLLHAYDKQIGVHADLCGAFWSERKHLMTASVWIRFLSLRRFKGACFWFFWVVIAAAAAVSNAQWRQ